MKSGHLSVVCLAALLLGQHTVATQPDTLLTPRALPRRFREQSSQSGATEGVVDFADGRGELLKSALTPVDLLRSPHVRFSQPLGGGGDVEQEPGFGGGAEAPIPDAARFDVGPVLTPRDFTSGEEQMQTMVSVPLVAGKLDPVELAGEFEGDIVLTPSDITSLTNGAVPGQRRWPGGVMRYAIASGFSSSERGVIAAALRELESRTCVSVQPVPPGRPSGDFIHIVRDRGCSSAVGRLGGNQTLSLDDGCFSRGVVLHQLLHAAGLWHEQSRPDRDRYVRVLSDNVAAGRLFELRSYGREPAPLTLGYQRRSLMHLSRWAFAADRNRPSLESTGDPNQPLGQRDGMTVQDASTVNLLYGCEDGTPPPLPQPPAVDPNCMDRNQHCKWWASRGECKRNPTYMNDFCAKACHQCTASGCDNLHRDCTRWAVLGQCDMVVSFMHVYCRRACGLCPQLEERPAVCQDTNALCLSWSGAGECHRNPEYMSVHCQQACGLC